MRKASYLLVALATLSASPHPASAQFDPVSAYGVVLLDRATGASDSWLKSKGAALGNGVVEAIEPLINRIMTERLPVLIGQVGAMIDDRIITVEQAGERLTKYIQQTFDAALQEALTHVGHFVETSIRDQIIEVAFTRARELERQIAADLSDLVLQVDRTAFCAVAQANQAITDQRQAISDSITSFLNALPFSRRSQAQRACASEYGITQLSGPSYTAGRQFLMWQCLITSSHSLETPSRTLSSDYVEIERRARGLFCSSLNADEGRNYYTPIIMEAARRARIWRIAADATPAP